MHHGGRTGRKSVFGEDRQDEDDRNTDSAANVHAVSSKKKHLISGRSEKAIISKVAPAYRSDLRVSRPQGLLLQ
jgi:hypothetical protein